MGETNFANNYHDQCVEHGANAGFQFEFFCQCCSATWRSDFVPFRQGQASSWLNRASSFFGGVMGNVTRIVDGMAESGFGPGRDKAFKEAIVVAETHFHRCAKCHQHVCHKCWNQGKGLCVNCAPNVQVEIEAARSQGEVQGAVDKATESGVKRGEAHEVERDRQLVCPGCGAQTGGAKFCPECGEKMAVKKGCPECQAQFDGSPKFCPECGHKLAG